MATPDREGLANGLVKIGEDAVAKSNDALFYEYFTEDYKLHSPAGDFNREEIKTYFAALRDSFTDFTISRAQILVDGNFVTARTVMAGRFQLRPPSTLRRTPPSRRPMKTVSGSAGSIARHCAPLPDKESSSVHASPASSSRAKPSPVAA
jgi:hypothetical protein